MTVSESEDKPASHQIGGVSSAAPDGDAPSSPADSLLVARRFLQEDQVKAASSEEKKAFLKSKGIPDAEILRLLAHNDPPESSQVSFPFLIPAHRLAPFHAYTTPQQDSTSLVTQQPRESAISRPTHDHPPILTYPEFLTKPQSPPPLVTTSRLLNALYAATGLATLLYGAGKFVFAPMVEDLADARSDFHHAVLQKLGRALSQLEETVSTPPSTYRTRLAHAAAHEDADDPSEMFHRDVATQTSDLPSPRPLTAAATAPLWEQQHAKLAALTRSLETLRDDLQTQCGDIQGLKSLVDDFRDDLDALTFPTHSELASGFGMYGRAQRHEPDDELRRVRDNARRVKGVLLRTKNFPAAPS